MTGRHDYPDLYDDWLQAPYQAQAERDAVFEAAVEAAAAAMPDDERNALLSRALEWLPADALLPLIKAANSATSAPERSVALFELGRRIVAECNEAVLDAVRERLEARS